MNKDIITTTSRNIIKFFTVNYTNDTKGVHIYCYTTSSNQWKTIEFVYNRRCSILSAKYTMVGVRMGVLLNCIDV